MCFVSIVLEEPKRRLIVEPSEKYIEPSISTSIAHMPDEFALKESSLVPFKSNLSIVLLVLFGAYKNPSFPILTSLILDRPVMKSLLSPLGATFITFPEVEDR